MRQSEPGRTHAARASGTAGHDGTPSRPDRQHCLRPGAPAACKHGLLGFSGSLLREAKAHGIKVSTVLPGIIDTAFNGALEGSEEETWALRASALADQVLTLFALPENIVIDELTIHPLQQDF